MKKYLALTVGYKQLLIPFDSVALFDALEKIIVCDEKGYGKDKRFEEDKDFDMSLTVVGESQIVFSESDSFDAVKKATAEAEKYKSDYWKLYVEFDEYKKQDPQQTAPAVAQIAQPGIIYNLENPQSVGNDLPDALTKIV